MDFYVFLIIIFLFLIIFIAGWFIVRIVKNRGRIARSLNYELFLITLPREKRKEGEKEKSEKEIISVMEQFYTSLFQIKEGGLAGFFLGRPALVFEIAIPEIGEEINFYLSCPRKFSEVLEKTIHGFYPTAHFERVEDYNIFNPNGVAAGSYLTLTRSHLLPFKTYQEMEVDPLNEITNALSKLEERGEGAAIQILIRPAPFGWAKTGLKIAKLMQEGKSFETAKAKVTNLGRITEFFKTNKQKTGPLNQPFTQPKPITPLQQEIIKSLEGKGSKVGFEVNIRLLASAASQARTEQILSHLENAFVQFSTPNLNSLKPVRVSGRSLKRLIYHFSFRIFNPRQKIILNTEELTSLYHFPSVQLATPKVKFLKAKLSAPPANLPKEGLVLGRNLYRGVETIIRLQKDDRRRHLYIIGQTGTGKSAFLQEMIKQDMDRGEGVCVLDPHGDLIESILGLIPQERVEDVILFNPFDLERPLGLNMLEYDLKYPEQKSFIVNEMISIFQKLFAAIPEALGPIFEQYTRNALLLIMDDPAEKATLMEVPKVLADVSYRKRLLAKCRNLEVKDFWEKEAEKAGGEAALANIVPYITSKFNIFIANDYMRPIIGQSKSSLNFREIIDQRKILLVNLSKGKLGDINSSLLGLIITGKLLIAALSRIDIPQENRQDFYLYMDEFQNFTTESIATILAEARKYRLCLIIAHQYIAQLEEKIKNAVFGNVGSIVCFRIGAEDAEFVVKQFEPVFDQNDLINIENFNAYVKLLINGLPSIPFNLLTYPPTQGNPEIASAVKEISRLKYGRERSLVEAEILTRTRTDTLSL